MIRTGLLLTILLSACGGGRVDLLVAKPEFQTGTSYICPDMTTVSVSEAQESTVASCLGAPAPGMGLSYICSTGSVPGSAACADSAMNPVHGTCVEAFLACYQPSGSCQGSSDSVQYENGASAKFELETGSYKLLNAGEDEPCVTVARVFFGSDEGEAFLHQE